MPSLLTYTLTSLSDVKESLGIANGDSSKDNLITRKINQATDMIEAYCQLPADHHFASTTYTDEEYDGGGTNQISLRIRPVTALTSFQYRFSSLNISNWNSIDSQYYFVDYNAGVIDLLFNQSFDWNRYRVSYTAGYLTIPSGLAEACANLASYLTVNASAGTAIKRKREGGREVEYWQPGQNSADSLMEELGIDDMVSRYINYAVIEDR